MEVKIGIKDVARELVVESGQTSEEVSALVASALQGGQVLELTDDKGRRIMVPVASIGYVEIGEPQSRKVGFGG